MNPRSFVEQEREAILELLCEAIAIDSTTGSEGELARFCAAWLERSKVTGIRLERTPDPSLPKGYDMKAVEDPNAEPLWARFYEIETNRPFFCGRDGVKKCEAVATQAGTMRAASSRARTASRSASPRLKGLNWSRWKDSSIPA